MRHFAFFIRFPQSCRILLNELESHRRSSRKIAFSKDFVLQGSRATALTQCNGTPLEKQEHFRRHTMRGAKSDLRCEMLLN
jgi:hypothetical protein